jgi:diadenosine tetraphosphate (Ap4A) HIT family hydrolase
VKGNLHHMLNPVDGSTPRLKGWDTLHGSEMNGPGPVPTCPLCQDVGGRSVWSDTEWRVVRVSDTNFPAFYRVISQPHVSELSQLKRPQRVRCMELVNAVESTLLRELQPTTINLASLGNVVPHLHWHVVARFDWDSHYPEAVWGRPGRPVSPKAESRLSLSLDQLDLEVSASLRQLSRT